MRINCALLLNISMLTAALLSAGCTMMPPYERPTAPVAGSYVAATGTNAPSAASLGWSEVFTDERLKKLVELALTNNLDLRVAVLNVEQSRAQYRITRSASLPTVNGSASYTRSHAAGVTAEQWNASLGTVAYEVDFWGRVRSLNRQALEKYFATDAARCSAQVTLVAEVATEYFTLREVAEQIQLAQSTLQTVQESCNLNQAMLAAGATSELDWRESQAQVATAKINLLTYQRLQAEAENALSLLIGGPLPADLPAARPLPDSGLLTDLPAGLPSELLERRPDILEAEHTLKAANADIGAARAAFFPSLALTASVGTTSSQLSQLFGGGTGVWSFSPQVTVPIFTGGQNLADLDAAKVSRRIEVANYQKAIQTAFREVSDALVDTASYARQTEQETLLVAAQQGRYDLASTRYRQGDDTYLNTLTAQQDLYAARQGLIQAQFNELASRISLYKALGGGWK